MLGNLGAKKGLHVFLALADVLRAENPRVRVILAGPVARRSDRVAIARRVADGALEWIGPLSGSARTNSFYRLIDLLVFPSLYAHEAEPLVLLEAMAHGVPVIATDRGCIRDLTGDAAVIVPDGVDFVGEARRVIRMARADRVWLQRKRASAWQRFQRERAAALREAATLLGILSPDDAVAGAPLPSLRGRSATSLASLSQGRPLRSGV